MSSSPDSASRKALLRNALRAVDDLQARLDASEKARREPIAVVGLGCRYPGAGDPEALWHLLRDGVDAVREVPAGRWDPEALDVGDAGERGRVAARLGGFLENVDLFDPAFFGISPREAATLDPQQRLLLEVAWETLENAGQAPDRLKGSRTGVFVGITTSDYARIVGVGEEKGHTDVYAATGNALNAAAGRIAFVLGLQGPCMAVDTACSSSLTATHLACQSLRAGDCDLAIAGGVNVVLSPQAALLFARWGMLASDGKCKTFDSAADGFVRSEGCGLVALKTLSRARADGDRVLALLLGSAVNQDGASSGLTVPNGPAQQAVIRQALSSAGLAPADVDYVEAHGTGTPIGDPIEVEALAAVMARGEARERPLLVGSIKTNIGHAEAASGMAGLLKLVLSLGHEAIPPHLHVQELNPRFDWTGRLEVPTELTPWPRRERPRIAGVSSFGFSGTNAHVLVAEAPDQEPLASEGSERPLQVLTLSAANEEALRESAGRLGERIATDPEIALPDVAFTLNAGRASLPHRAALLASDPGEARDRLAALAAAREVPGVFRGRVDSGVRPRIGFLFTGQGSQYAGMGRVLYETEPLFRTEIDRCDDMARSHAGFSLREVMLGEDDDPIHRTQYTQPGLFALEWGLARLWSSWGVEPSCLLGHSIGEYAAACFAGAMSLEDGMRLVLARGRLMGALPEGGAMVSCLASEEQVQDVLEERGAHEVSIAAVNGPESVVISGSSGAVETVAAALADAEVKTRSLTVSHAFHSALLDPMLDEYEREAAGIDYRPPRTELMSNLTGRALAEGEIDGRYWRRHARSTVRFLDGMRGLQEHGCTVFLEIGPQPVLIGMGQGCLSEGPTAWLPSLRRDRDDWSQLLESVGRLFCAGGRLDWPGFDRGRDRARLALPTYPFQRERHWVEASRSSRRPARRGRHPFLGPHVHLGSAQAHVWEGELSMASFPFLRDHRVQSGAIVPATAWTEMALEAFAEAHGPGPVALDAIDYLKPLFLGEEAVHDTQVVLFGEEVDGRFEISSRLTAAEPSAATPWVRHTTGRIRRGEAPGRDPAPFSLAEVREACPREVAGEEFYRLLGERGNNWGPSFQGLQRVWCGEGEAWSECVAPEGPGMGLEPYVFHPALSDAAGHVLTATVPLARSDGSRGGAFVGGGIDELRVYRGPAGRRVRAWARLRSSGEEESNLLVGDVKVFDEDGGLVSELRGARLWYLDDDASRLRRVDVDDCLYELAWRPRPAETQPEAPTVETGGWVVVGEPGAFVDDLASSLRGRGAACATVDDSADLLSGALRDALAALGGPCRGIVHITGVLEGPPSSPSAEAECTRVVRLLEALAALRLPDGPRLWLVTAGAQAVGSPPQRPLGAAIWGLGRSLALEQPEVWGGLVDLDLSASEAMPERLTDHLLSREPEDQVALRGGECLAPRLVRGGSASASGAPVLRRDATYLVTGGLGGLGLEVARDLIERGARRLVLMGRTPPPDRRRWAGELDARDARTVAALRDLEAMGAQVLTAAVDVGDRDGLAIWLEEFRREAWPPLRGVVHAAGTLHHQTLADEEPAGFEAVMRPKTTGAWNLHEVLGDEELDFFILFSSASALLSSPRLGAYAAANATLDALAHYRRGLGRPATSINWGVWGEAGMAARFDADELASLAGRGMGTLTSDRAIEALRRVLAKDLAQAAVLPVDWEEWGRRYPALVGAPFLSEVVSAAPAQEEASLSGAREAVLAAPEEEREARVADFLADQLVRVMQIPAAKLDVQQPLHRLGLDSLMAVEIRNGIESGLGVSLPLTTLLEGPPVIALATQVLERLGETLAPEKSPAPAAVEEGPVDAQRAALLLEQIDGLSDQQVERLLGQLSEDRKE